MCARFHHGGALWLLGHADQALGPVRQALQLAQELAHPLTTVVALYYAAWLYYNLGDHQAATESVDTMLALAQANGFPLWIENASMLTAGLMLEQGRFNEGIARLERGLISATKARWSWREAFCLCLLADAYSRAGQPEKGFQTLSQIMQAPESGTLYDPELLRMRGELLVKQGGGGVDEGEQCFRRAIQITRSWQTKALQLRASISLARLLDDSGRRGEAFDLLKDTYHQFAEGFETRDLRNAKAVLDNLARA